MSEPDDPTVLLSQKYCLEFKRYLHRVLTLVFAHLVGVGATDAGRAPVETPEKRVSCAK